MRFRAMDFFCLLLISACRRYIMTDSIVSAGQRPKNTPLTSTTSSHLLQQSNHDTEHSHTDGGDNDVGDATGGQTSWRKICPGRIRAKAITEAYQGLPDDLPHPNEILKIFATAGDCLPFPSAALRTLNALATFAHTVAWDHEYGPFVWPTNETLSVSTGLALRTVKTHLSMLEEAGAIYVKLGPGGRRRPLNTRNVQSPRLSHDANYGIYLTPLAEMAVQVHRETQRMCEAARLASSMRGRITECYQEISACIDALLDFEDARKDARKDASHSVTSALQQLRLLEQDVMEIASNITRSRRPDDLQPSLDYALQCRSTAYARAEEIMAWIADSSTAAPSPEAVGAGSSFFGPDEQESPEGAESGTQNTTTQPSNNSKRYTEPDEHGPSLPSSNKSAGSTGKMALEKSVVQPSKDDPAPPSEEPHPDQKTREAIFTPGLALFLYPALADIGQTYLGIAPETADQMTMAQFQALIDILRGQIGLSDSAHHQALQSHGFNRVSALVIIAAIKPASELRVDRKAFLAGTLKRPVDQVHIWPTLHKLRKLRASGGLAKRPAAAPVPDDTLSDGTGPGTGPDTSPVGPDPVIEEQQAVTWIESCSKLRQDMLYSMFSRPPSEGADLEDRKSRGWMVAAR